MWSLYLREELIWDQDVETVVVWDAQRKTMRKKESTLCSILTKTQRMRTERKIFKRDRKEKIEKEIDLTVEKETRALREENTVILLILPNT